MKSFKSVLIPIALIIGLFGCSTSEKRATKLLQKTESLLNEALVKEKESFTVATPIYTQARTQLLGILQEYGQTKIVTSLMSGEGKITGAHPYDWIFRLLPSRLEAGNAEDDLLESALLLARKAENVSKSMEFRMKIARSFLQKGRKDKAVRIMNETMLGLMNVRDPMARSRLFTSLADLSYQLGHHNEAREELDQAFQFLPSAMNETDDTFWNDTRADMSRLYAEFGEAERAVKIIEAMGEWCEGASFDTGCINDSALTRVAKILLSNHLPEKALPIIDHLGGAIDLEIIKELVDEGEGKAALTVLEKTKEMIDDSANLLFLSRLLERLGNPRDSQLAFNRAVSDAETIKEAEATESDGMQGYWGEDVLAGTLEVADELEKRGNVVKADELRGAALNFIEQRCFIFAKNKNLQTLAHYYTKKGKSEIATQMVERINDEETKLRMPLVLIDGLIAGGYSRDALSAMRAHLDKNHAEQKNVPADMIESAFDLCIKLGMWDEAFGLIDQMGSPSRKIEGLQKLIDPQRWIGLSNETVTTKLLKFLSMETDGLVRAQGILEITAKLGNTKDILGSEAKKILHGWIASISPQIEFAPSGSDEKIASLRSYLINKYVKGISNAMIPGCEVVLYRELRVINDWTNRQGKVLALNCKYPNKEDPEVNMMAEKLPFIAFITPQGYVGVFELPGEVFNEAVGEGCDAEGPGKNSAQTCMAIDLDKDGIQEVVALTYEGLGNSGGGNAFMTIHTIGDLVARIDLDESGSEADEGEENLFYSYEGCEFQVKESVDESRRPILAIDSEFKNVNCRWDGNETGYRVRYKKFLKNYPEQ